MKEALRSFETLVLTRATRRNIPEDAIFQEESHIYGNNIVLFRNYLLRWIGRKANITMDITWSIGLALDDRW
jgi:hypothetical protein